MLKSLRAEVFLVFGSSAFAFNGIIAKLLLTSGLSASRLTQVRCTGAFLVLFLYVLARKRAEMKTSRAELPWLIAYGVIGFSIVQAFYFLAISRMQVGISLIIEFTAPIWIVLYIRFIRKRFVPPLMWISLSLAFSGLLLVARVWDGMTLDGLGVVAAFIDAFALAAYFLLGEKLVAHRSTDTLTVWGLGIATAFWLIVTPVWDFPYQVFTQDINLLGIFSPQTLPGWVLILWVITMGTLVPYICVLHGLKQLSASTSSVIGMLEPVVAGGFAWWWLREVLTPIQVFGSVVVIVGIILADRARSAAH